MKNIVRTLSYSCLVASLIAVGACTPAVKLDPTPVVDHSNDGMSTSGADTGAVDRNTVKTVQTAPAGDMVDPFTKRSVYFDYDSYLVKDGYQPVVTAHAKYLQANGNKKVLIQGNTDERGGSEYNLALGQKRAEAVRKQLQLLGVPESQIEAVSFGKEKPKATGHDEAAWAENRRADLVYQQ